MKRLLTLLYLVLGLVLYSIQVDAQYVTNGPSPKYPSNGNAFINLPDTTCWNSFASVNAFLWNSTGASSADWTITGGNYTILYTSDPNSSSLTGQAPDPAYGKNALTIKFLDKGLYTITAVLYVGSKKYRVYKSIYVKDCSIIPCQGKNTGVGDFKENFGNFKVNDPNSVSNPNVPPTTQNGYNYVPIPLNGANFTDNSYTVYWQSQIRPEWVYSLDHTGSNSPDSVGGMLIANASYDPKFFFVKPKVPVCPGSLYNFSAWFMNLNSLQVFNATCAAGNSDGYHYAGVTFYIVNSATKDTIARFKTYDVSMNLDGPQWQMYGGGFKTPGGVTQVDLVIGNDRPGGCGNDIAIDDISFTYCSPYIYSFIDGQSKPPLRVASLCEGAPVTIKAIYSPTNYFQNPVFQWEYSYDAVNWQKRTDSLNLITGSSDSVLVFKTGALTGASTIPKDIYFRVNILEQGNASNCAAPSEYTKITVLPKPKVTVSSGRICQGNPVTVTAAGGYSTYKWRVTPEVVGPSITVFPNVTTSYRAVGIANYGLDTLTGLPRQCMDSGQAQVIVDAKPVTKISGGPTQLCKGGSVTLQVTNSGAPVDSISWKWYYGATLIDSIITITHTPTDTGNIPYNVVLNNKTCNAYDTLWVKVRSMPKADVDTTYRQCTLNDFNIRRSTPPADQSGVWIFNGNNKGAVIVSPNSAQTTVKGVQPGDTVRLFWVITNNAMAACTDTNRVTLINTKALTPVTVGNDVTQCGQRAFQLNGTRPGTGETGAWSLATGTTAADVSIDYPNNYNAIATILGTTTPKTVGLIWSITNGVCPGSTSAAIKLKVKSVPTVNITASPVCNTTDSFTVNYSAVSDTIKDYILKPATTRVMPGFSTITGTWPDANTSGSFKIKLPAGTPAGSYDFILTAKEDTLHGCSIDVPFSVGVEKPSTAPTGITATVDSLCVSGTTTLTVTGGSLGVDSTGKSVKWRWYTGACPGNPGSVKATPKSANADSSQVVFDLTSTTTYYVRAEGAGACANTSCASIIVTVFPKPNLAATAGDQVHCNDSVFYLTGNTPVGTGARGVWRYNGKNITITDSTLGTTKVIVPAGQTVNFTWWITNGVCDSSSAKSVISNYDKPNTATAAAIPAHCNDSVFTLTGNNPTMFGAKGVWRYTNKNISITDSTKYNTQVIVPAGQTATFTWWITNGYCDSTSAKVTVTNYDKVNTATTQPIVAKCNDSVYILTGNKPTALGAKGVWRFTGTNIKITDSTLYNSQVIVPAGQTATFTWWITNGFCDSTNAKVTITNYDKVNTATTQPIVAKCNDSVYILTGNKPTALGAKGVWRFTGTNIKISDSTLYNSQVIVPAGQTANFTWWITNGYCDSSSAKVSITNYDKVNTATTQPIVAKCNDSVYILTGNKPTALGAKGVWRFTGTNIKITDSTLYNSQVIVPAGQTANFTWWITNGYCDSSSAKVSITNYDKVNTATTQPIVAKCNDSVYILTGNKPTAFGAKGVWRFTGTNIKITDSTLYNSQVIVPAGQTANFTWWITNGYCDSSSAKVSITNYDMVNAAATQPITAKCNDSVYILTGNKPTALGAKGVWRFTGTNIKITDSTLYNSQVIVPAGQTANFTWWITNGYCDSSSAKVSITNYDKVNTATTQPITAKCNDSVYILTGNKPTAFGAKGVWRFTGTNIKITDSTLYNSQVIVPAGQTANFTWWITNGYCDSSSAKVSITNYDKVNTATTQPIAAKCNDSVYILTGNKPTALGAKGVWRFTGTNIKITDSTLYNSQVIVPAGQTANFTWWITNGYCDSTSAKVSITNYDKVNTATTQPIVAKCNDSVYILTGNKPTALGAKGVWRFTGTNIKITDSTLYNSQVIVPAGQTATFTWWITNGYCDSSSAKVSITNYDKVNTATTQPIVAKCNDSLYILTGNKPTALGAKGVWRFTGTNIKITDSTLYNSQVIVPAGQTANFTWWITNGYCDSSSAKVSITNYDKVNTATTQPIAAKCNDSVYILTGNKPTALGAKGVWRFTGTNIKITDSTLYNSQVIVPAGQAANFTWWITNGYCDSSSAKVSITNYDKVNTATTQPIVAKCNDSVYILTGNKPTALGAKGVWRFTGTNIKITDSTLYNSQVIVPAGQTANFTWWITNGYCDSSSAKVSITNYDKVNTATTQPIVAKCNDSLYILTGNKPTALGAKGVWRFTGTNIKITDSTLYNSQVIVPAGQTANFTWWITNGYCDSSSAKVSITNYDKVNTATTQPIVAKCNDSVYILTGNKPTAFGAKGVWRFTGTNIKITDSTLYNSQVIVPAGQTANFTWWITNGYCDSSSAKVSITNYDKVNTATTQPIAAKCNDSVYILTGNKPTALGAKGVWRFTGTNIKITDSTLYNSQVIVPAGQTANFTWWITNGYCDSSSTKVSITNYDKVNTATTLPIAAKCNDSVYILTGNKPTTLGAKGVWRFTGTNIKITDSTLYNSQVIVPAGQTANFTWWITNGYCDSSSAKVSISNYDKVNTATTQPIAAKCNDSVYILTGNKPTALGAKGVWRFTGTNIKISDSTLYNSQVIVPAGQTANFTWWITNGYCDSSSAKVSITNYNKVNTATTQPIAAKCNDSVYILTGNKPTALGAKGVWRFTGTNIKITDSTLYNSQVIVPAGQTANFTWWITNGYCDSSSAKVSITNYDKVNTATTQPIVAKCNDSVYILTGNKPTAFGAKGVWRFTGTNIKITDSTLYNSQVIVPAGQTANFTWWITNGYCDSSSAKVSITNYDKVNTATTQPIVAKCNDSVYILTGNKPTTLGAKGVWRFTGTNIKITDSTLYNSQVIVPAGQTANFTWWITNGYCDSSSAKVSITNYDKVNTATTQPIVAKCNDSLYILTGNKPTALGAKGVWRFTGTNIKITDSTLYNSQVIVPAGQTANFTWWITNGYCDSSSAKVSITNYDKVNTATTQPIAAKCNDSVYILTGNKPTALGAKGVWRFTGTNIKITDSTLYNSQVIVPAGQTANFTWWITNGYCDSSSAKVSITNYDKVNTATVLPVTAKCNDSVYVLTGNKPTAFGAKGVWRFTGTNIRISDSTLYNPQVIVPAGQTATFTWWITNGYCDSSSAKVSITNYDKVNTATTQPIVAKCNDSVYILTGNKPTALGAKGVWRFTGTNIKITDSTLYNSQVIVPAGQTANFTWWITNGYCDSSSAKVSITNYDKVNTATTQPIATKCNDSVYILTGNKPTALGAKGVWRFTGTNIKITDSTLYNSQVIVPAGQTANFIWWITNGYCDSSSAKVTITNYDKVNQSTVQPINAHCNDSVFTLTGNKPTALGAKGVWRFTGTNISISDSTLYNSRVIVPAGQTANFTWWITNGYCDSSSASLKITNFQRPAVATVGKDQAHCNDSLFTLSGNTPTEYGAHGVWRYPTTFRGVIRITDSTLANTTVMVPAGNTVPFTWWITNGLCDSTSATLNLTNYAVASKANAGANQQLCNNTGDFIMTANSPGVPTAIGIWTDISRVPGRAIIKSPNNPATAVTVPVGDTAVLQWAIANGVCDTTFSRVTIINYKEAITAYAGPDQEKCNTNADFIMNASQPGVASATGTWTDVSRVPGLANIKDKNNPASAVTVPIGDTVILKWTVANGTCSSTSSTVTLINYKKADSAYAGPDISMCNNNGDFTMAAYPPSVPSAKGFWSIVKGNAVIKAINNPATAVNINVGDTVVLRWTVTNGVCSATWSDVTLINYQLPVAANAGTNQEHCNDSSFTMNASDPGVPGAKGTWIVTSNNASLIGISNINDRKAVITVPAGETAQLTWVVSNGVCNATSSSVTLINRKPILGNTIQRDQNVCITETPMAIRSNALSGGNGIYSYQWQQSTAGAGGPFANIAGANADVYQPGVLSANTWYRRIVTSGACIDNISNVVKITIITINPVVTFTPPAMTVECEKGKDYTTYFGTPVFSHLPYDNEPLTVTYSDVTVVTSPCLSTITRTWTATDRCNLSVTTSQTITIRDTKAPVFTSPAPADTTVDCDKVPAGVALKAMDDCAGEVIIPFVEVRQDLPGNCSNNYLLIRTWTSKDACNTGVTLRQVVTVKDMTAPVFNVPTPADTTVDCDKIPAGINLTATDNCTPGIITVIPKDSAVHNPGSCNSNYVIYRKWTAFDECGNSRAVQQMIQVQDTTRPVFSMPAPKDTVVDCDKVPAWPVITASDNCSGNIQVFTNSKTIKQSGNCANNYQEIRTWTATDECGNKSEMKQVITVQDTTRPVFTVRPPADTMVSCDNIPAPATNVQISDNCSTIGNGLVLSRRIYTESIPGACASNYRIIRMWIAKDACGNADTVKQVLTVKDTTRPVIMPAPADVVLYCQDKIPAPPVLTATDNCDNSFPKNAIYTEDPYVADICNGYTIIRRWSITDACGNKADDVIQRVIINPCDKPKLEATLPSNCSDNGRIALRKVGKVYLPTYTLVAVTPANAVPGLPRSQNNNVFNLNGATSASFIITDGRTGCSSDTVTYQLSYIRKPAVHLGNDTTICGGNSLVLDAGPANFAYKIQWSTGETTQRIVVKQAGTYWVNVSNGECATTDSIHVALIPTPLVSIPDTTICRGQSVKLDAYVNGAQYLWSNGSTASSILVSTQEQFWVKVMKAGCITIDTVKVSVNPPPDISLSRDTAICPDQAVMLTVSSNGGRIRWQTGETGNSIVVNQPGAYWVAVSRDNCVVKDTVNVRLKPELKLDLGPDRNICPGATITLNGTNPDAISYLWNDGDPNPVKQVSQSGKYKLAVMDKYCQRVYTASVNVNTTGLPVINLGRDTTLCVGETLTLRAEGGGITSARWDDGTYGPTRTVSSAGTYIVTVSNDCGTANDNITVSVVQCEPKPVVPNAFSPNGDGRNDVFRPVVRGQMFDYQLRIFNRWGELIFLSEDAHKGWDGKYKGVPVEVGTYVWWLSYKKVPGGPINVLKGEVTVIR